MTPKIAASNLRYAANLIRQAKSTQPAVKPLAVLIRAIEGGRKASGPGVERFAGFLEQVAASIEKDAKPSREKLASVLRQAMADILLANTPPFLGNSPEVVRKTFKENNPKLTDEDLDKMVKHWEENKDNAKQE